MRAVRSKPGCLYVIATPIGNLGDLSERAKESLSQVDLIAAEDTRHSRILLGHYGITTPMISLHEYNEANQAIVLIKRILEGQNIALISDAGTPLISDPGYKLVDLAHKHAISIKPIPGASAVMAAVSVAGISTASYLFVGFLSAKAKQRRNELEGLINVPHTLVLFESPHRISGLLDQLVDVFGEERQACLCREITKQFETIQRLSLGELKDFVNQDKNQRRGEIVLVIEGCNKKKQTGDSLDYEKLLKALLEQMPLKQAAQLLASSTSQSRNYFYELGLSFKRGG